MSASSEAYPAELAAPSAAAAAKRPRPRRRRAARKEGTPSTTASSGAASTQRESSEDETSGGRGSVPQPAASGRSPVGSRNVVTWSDLLGDSGALQGPPSEPAASLNPVVGTAAALAPSSAWEDWSPQWSCNWNQPVGFGAEPFVPGVPPPSPYGGAPDQGSPHMVHIGQPTFTGSPLAWTADHLVTPPPAPWPYQDPSCFQGGCATAPPCQAAPALFGATTSSANPPPPPRDEADLDMVLRALADKDAYED